MRNTLVPKVIFWFWELNRFWFPVFPKSENGFGNLEARKIKASRWSSQRFPIQKVCFWELCAASSQSSQGYTYTLGWELHRAVKQGSNSKFQTLKQGS